VWTLEDLRKLVSETQDMPGDRTLWLSKDDGADTARPVMNIERTKITINDMGDEEECLIFEALPATRQFKRGIVSE
jgi:hypothetical protein